MRKLNILIYGFGLEVEHAVDLALRGNNVRYYTAWGSNYPTFESYAPGLGYESIGMEKVMYFWPNVEWADLICTFEVGLGDIADQCRKLGKPVFGSSVEGDKLENNRELMRQLQEKMGLPVQKTDIVKGIPALREYIKKNPEKYVKLDVFRKDCESFYAKNYEEVEAYLDSLEVTLGPFNETYRFMLEDKIDDAIEPGFDMMFNGKKWIKPMLWGIEQSKTSYVGTYVNELPKPLQKVADAYEKILTKIDYRGAMSIEVKVKKDGTPYLLDTCSRYPYPLSTLYTLSIKNYTEVLWRVANGKDVEIETGGKYVAALPLSSDVGEKQYVLLDIPEKYKKFVKTRTSAIVKEKTYSVKGNNIIYLLVACGNDYTKLIEFLTKLSDKVSAFKLDTTNVAYLKQIEQEIPKYKEYGMGEF